MEKVKVIAFDADDTLWVNEPYFRETEDKFCALLEDYLPHHTVHKELFKMEIANLDIYGYGVKGFMLSMVETAINITGNTSDAELINKIILLGKEMLNKPIELLDNVEQVLQSLQGKYKLVMATKGDLLDQETKLIKSGLESYFHHIEVMSDKKESDFKKLLKHLDCQPEAFMMIGNSLKSDILPVIKMGAKGIHVPYHTTWVHETINHKIENENYYEAKSIINVLDIIH